MKFSTTSLAAAVFSAVHAQNSIITWSSTTRISEAFSSSITVRYGSTPIRPVPTSTAPIEMATSYINEPVASRNINQTTWLTVVATEPLESRWDVVYTAGTTPPPTVTVDGTTTETVRTNPTVATVTFSPTTCTNGLSPPKSTVTTYTGEYTPFPGQITITKSSWPTAVTTYYFLTGIYKVFTFTGSTTTFTSTFTGTTYLSTTVGTRTFDINDDGKYYTRTRYRHTVTHTNRNHQLAYTTIPIPVACDPSTPTTVTLAAQCAPTNLIRERDGRGIEVRVSPNNWTFPIGFPNTLIGIPGLDAPACCQLCVDNKGCAVSQWEDRWRGGCSLLFFNSPGLNDTCGTVPLEYFGDVWSLPEQGSFVQTGCGSLTYLGVRDQYCPTCQVS